MNRKPKALLVVLAYIVTVHAPITALTWRDLQERPDAQVRGSKRIWRMASALNTAGSVTYWLYGRRPPAQLTLFGFQAWSGSAWEARGWALHSASSSSRRSGSSPGTGMLCLA